MAFVTKDVDCSISNLNLNYDIETTETADVYWHAEVENMSWGIASITAYIDSIELRIDWNFVTDDEETVIPQEFIGTDGEVSLTIKDGENGWTINCDIDLQDDGQMMPSDVDVDWKKKVINVS